MEHDIMNLKEISIDNRTLNLMSKTKPELFIMLNDHLYINKKMKQQLLDYYQEVKALHLKYSKDDNYLRMHYFSLMCGLSPQELILKLDKEISSEYYVRIPRLRPEKNCLDPLYIYYFRKDLLEYTAFKFRSLNQVAFYCGLTPDALYDWERKGLLPEPKFRNEKGTGYYDCVEIKNLVPSIQEQTIRKPRKGNFDELNQIQQKLISDFIFFRKNGGTLKNSYGIRIKKFVANPNQTLKDMQEDISSVFFLIICGRCGIYQKELKNYAALSDENKKRFNPDVFDPLSINEQDYFFISAHRKTNTLINISRVIDQFYSWILRNLKSEFNDVSDLEGFKKYKQFNKMNHEILNFLEQFPKNENERPNSEKVKVKTKSFLTREQMIVVKQKILKDPKSKDPFKVATLWQFCCSTAIRPEETLKLRIEYFLLDQNGFLSLNKRGWGILDLPSEASKQGMSPSNKTYKTPIPPETVFQINEYLRRVYKKQQEIGVESIGKGFLFHPVPHHPEMPYRSHFYVHYFHRFREVLDFLTQAQRHDFLLKASRHSMNNLIDGYKVILPVEELNGKVQKVAADLQMRHKPAKDIGEQSYTELISEDDFYQVLDLTINFPWDLEKLVEWEIDKGYRKPQIENRINNVKDEPSQEKSSEIEQLKSQLTNVENELNKYKKRPKELSPVEWSKITKDLRQEKEQIKKALQII